MEYRTKAAIVMALIFFFLLTTVTVIYLGVKTSTTDKTEKSFEGGILVERIVDISKDSAYM